MIRILYQDEHLLVVEKPAGLSAQEDAAGGDSLPRQLAVQGLPVLPVHRLDKNTGGVMVYARTKQAAAGLSAIVGQHEIFLKEYIMLVSGCPQPARGELHDLLYHDVRRNKSYVVTRERRGVRRAALSYAVAGSFAAESGTVSLVRVRLHTGRTHQIRVQFASRRMPLLGDARYGGTRGCPLALYSCRLTFRHPVTGEIVSAACLPERTAAPWSWIPGAWTQRISSAFPVDGGDDLCYTDVQLKQGGTNP